MFNDRKVWLAYFGACLLAWLLYVLAGTEFQRGLWQLWEAVYQATLSLWAPMLLGVAVYPWARALHRRDRHPAIELALHVIAALAFGLAWLGCEYGTLRWLYGVDHASAMLKQTALWRLIWGVVVYAAITTGFTALLQARRARAAALAAAQAESALARAELSAISGKLDPHFLFNTLNSLIALTRKDPRAAEEALLKFSNMLRYVLDSKRSASGRVPLAEEIEFVRDYLALESLRLGARLHIDWQLDPQTLQDEIPPLRPAAAGREQRAAWRGTALAGRQHQHPRGARCEPGPCAQRRGRRPGLRSGAHRGCAQGARHRARCAQAPLCPRL